MGQEMTREEFEEEVSDALESGVLEVVECGCGEEGCKGWKLVPCDGKGSK